MHFKLKKMSLKKTLKKIELNKEPNKRRKNETNEKKIQESNCQPKKRKWPKSIKTVIFLKKRLGSTYTPHWTLTSCKTRQRLIDWTSGLLK